MPTTQPLLTDTGKEFNKNLDTLRHDAKHTSETSKYLTAAYYAKMAGSLLWAAPKALVYDAPKTLYNRATKSSDFINAEKKEAEEARQAHELSPSDDVINLLAYAYRDIMTPFKNKGNKVWFYGENKEGYEALRSDLAINAQFLTKRYLKEVEKNNPLANYKNEIKKLIDAPLPDFTATTPEKLKEAQATIIAHQNSSGGNIDNIASEYAKKLQELMKVEGIEQLDPTSVHAQLQQLRESTKKEVESYKQLKLDNSNELFDAAIKLANKASLPEGTDKEKALKARAKALLDKLKAAGPLTNSALSVDGSGKPASGDTVIAGGPTTPTSTLEVSDEAIVKTLEQLKTSEATRITAGIEKQNAALNNQLTNIAEEQHKKLNSAILASAMLSRLNNEQDLANAQNFILHSTSSSAGAGEQDALYEADFDSVEALNHVIRNRNPPGLSGPGWMINFTPNEGSTGLDGGFSVSFDHNSTPEQKLEAIKAQASLIAIKSQSITWTAESSDPQTGDIDPNESAKIAVLQAIATLETSGLDPDKAKFKICLGRNDKNEVKFSDPLSLKQLQTFSTKDKNGNVIVDMKQHFAKHQKKFDAAMALREGHDEKYEPAEKFEKTKAALNEIKGNEPPPPAETARGGPSSPTT